MRPEKNIASDQTAKAKNSSKTDSTLSKKSSVTHTSPWHRKSVLSFFNPFALEDHDSIEVPSVALTGELEMSAIRLKKGDRQHTNCALAQSEPLRRVRTPLSIIQKEETFSDKGKPRYLINYGAMAVVVCSPVLTAMIYIYNFGLAALRVRRELDLDTVRVLLPLIAIGSGMWLLLSCLFLLGQHMNKVFKRLLFIYFLYSAVMGVGEWYVGFSPCMLHTSSLATRNRTNVTASDQSFIWSLNQSKFSCKVLTDQFSEADCIKKIKLKSKEADSSRCSIYRLPDMCTDLPKVCKEIDSSNNYGGKMCEYFQSDLKYEYAYATLRSTMSSKDLDTIASRYTQVKLLTETERLKKFDRKYRNRGTDAWNEADPDGRILLPNNIFDAQNISREFKVCFSRMTRWPSDSHKLVTAILGRLMCEGTFNFCSADGTPQPTCSYPTCGVIDKLQRALFEECDHSELMYEFNSSHFNTAFDYMLSTMRTPVSRKLMSEVHRSVEHIMMNQACGESEWYSSSSNCMPHGSAKVSENNVTFREDHAAPEGNPCTLSDRYAHWITKVQIFIHLSCFGLLVWSLMVLRGAAQAVFKINLNTNEKKSNKCCVCMTEDFPLEAIAVIVVVVLASLLAGILLWTRHLAWQYERVLRGQGDFQERQGSHLESTKLVLLLSSCILVGDGVVNATASWVFRKSGESDLILKARDIYQRRRSNASSIASKETVHTTEAPSIEERESRWMSTASIRNNVVLYIGVASQNFDAWFSFGRGKFYLELIFLLEFIETVNQVIQVFVFGSMRPFQWVTGICILLILNTLFSPAPLLISHWGGTEMTSHTLAAMVDLTLDSMYLMLSVFSLNVVEPFAGNDWWIAVSGCVIPTFGALKTLHEVYITTTVAVSQDTEVHSDLYQRPSACCLKYGQRAGRILVLLTVVVSITFATYFLVLSHKGYRICEAKMGKLLASGARPLIVLDDSLSPYCSFNKITEIVAPFAETTQMQQLVELPPLIRDMRNLEHIDVSGHNISAIPSEMLDNCVMPNLKSVNFARNPVSHSLSVSSYSNLDYVPNRIFDFFPGLVSLSIRNTNVKCLPKSLHRLERLERLDAENSSISYISASALIPMQKHSSAFLANVSIKLSGTPISQRLDWSREFSQSQSSELYQELGNISKMFPDLLELSLAGNYLSVSQLPKFNKWSKLKKLNLSQNQLADTPWILLQENDLLESLDLSGNRLTSSHFQMTTNGLTCRMLELIRSSLKVFDTHNNNFHYVSFGEFYQGNTCTDALPFIEQHMLTYCPQGPEKTLLATRELVRFILPSLSGISYSLAHFSNGRANGCFERNSGRRLSLGRGLTLKRIFEWANPKIFRFLQIVNLPSGPLPSHHTIKSFRNLSTLVIQGDFRPGMLNASIYEFSNLVKFNLRGFPDMSIICIYDCFWPNATALSSYSNRLFSLPAGFKRFQKLQTFRISDAYALYYGDHIVKDLFHLPQIRRILLSHLRFESISPREIFSLLKHPKELSSLEISNIRGPQWNPQTTWPDFSVLRHTSLRRLGFTKQNFTHVSGNPNTFDNMTMLTQFVYFDLCGNTGLEYPSPHSPLGLKLQAEVFSGNNSNVGSEVAACVSQADTDAGNTGPLFQRACKWDRSSGLTTKASGYTDCATKIVYGRDGKVKESATTKA